MLLLVNRHCESFFIWTFVQEGVNIFELLEFLELIQNLLNFIVISGEGFWLRDIEYVRFDVLRNYLSHVFFTFIDSSDLLLDLRFIVILHDLQRQQSLCEFSCCVHSFKDSFDLSKFFIDCRWNLRFRRHWEYFWSVLCESITDKFSHSSNCRFIGFLSYSESFLLSAQLENIQSTEDRFSISKSCYFPLRYVDYIR